LEQVLARLLPDEADPLLTRFAAYWCACRGGMPMPRLADMDPVGMPWALSTVFVLKRRGDGAFAYHLVGEDMVDRLGGGLRGKTAFDVFEPGYAAWTEERWQQAAAERSACFVRTHHLTKGEIPVTASRVLFPLAGDGDGVDLLIGVTAFASLDDLLGDVAHHARYDPTLREVLWLPVTEIPR
jgi:hypothetical protein